MRSPDIVTTRLAALIILHAARAGFAAPSVLVTRPVSRLSEEWLPMDNQTLYTLEEGESRNLELNTSSISQTVVYITVSPCSRHLHWAFYKGPAGSDKQLQLIQEHGGGEMHTITFQIFKQERYVLQLSSPKGGAAAISVRGEATRHVRIRLRTRSKRRLSANWDPSPIDPQSTTYCVVASRRKNYTSLCAAQYDLRNTKTEKDTSSDQSLENHKPNRSQNSGSEENKIDIDKDSISIFDGNYRTLYRRKKFGRSTRVSNEDPLVVCIGDRTHHFIENLDPGTTYFVSIFGIARDRQIGSLLASGSVRPRTSTAKRLRENVPYKADIKGKNVYYLKTTTSSTSTNAGLWIATSTCGGSVDIEVYVKGKRLYVAKNIENHSKFFVPSPILSSTQETSDEGSVQFDSSSEESKIRYIVRVVPNKWAIDGAVTIELLASTSRWGMDTPELTDGGVIRELRPRRSCKSVDIAFLPATHNATDVIRYCISTKEIVDKDITICALTKKSSTKTQCISHMQRPQSRVIVQKVSGLKPGRKYGIQVTAASKGISVPYNVLYVETNATCKEE
ncbi:protein NDNF-like [Danaus plexippus]|uniref:protein NDNF-like n=1 Tax=Danaus plexippus TaxID=13037 RepID=UPI002AAF72A8|nr:protein NDNF-like [Danaus plexippus]